MVKCLIYTSFMMLCSYAFAHDNANVFNPEQNVAHSACLQCHHSEPSSPTSSEFTLISYSGPSQLSLFEKHALSEHLNDSNQT